MRGDKERKREKREKHEKKTDETEEEVEKKRIGVKRRKWKERQTCNTFFH